MGFTMDTDMHMWVWALYYHTISLFIHVVYRSLFDEVGLLTKSSFMAGSSVTKWTDELAAEAQTFVS